MPQVDEWLGQVIDDEFEGSAPWAEISVGPASTEPGSMGSWSGVGNRVPRTPTSSEDGRDKFVLLVVMVMFVDVVGGVMTGAMDLCLGGHLGTMDVQ